MEGHSSVHQKFLNAVDKHLEPVKGAKTYCPMCKERKQDVQEFELKDVLINDRDELANLTIDICKECIEHIALAQGATICSEMVTFTPVEEMHIDKA